MFFVSGGGGRTNAAERPPAASIRQLSDTRYLVSLAWLAVKSSVTASNAWQPHVGGWVELRVTPCTSLRSATSQYSRFIYLSPGTPSCSFSHLRPQGRFAWFFCALVCELRMRNWKEKQGKRRMAGGLRRTRPGASNPLAAQSFSPGAN